MSNLLSPQIKRFLSDGTVIPAHPLALDSSRKLDEKHQRALTRYYMDAGAGGVAVGVHTTQFEIRLPQYNLYETVLRMAAEEVDQAKLNRPFIRVAGISGPTAQAVNEAEIARGLKYDIALLSNGGLASLTEDQLIERVQRISEVIPVFGFYLQPAVGGRILSFDFWARFAANKNVHAIKVAAFNRYQTMDVVRAVCQSDRADDIALYTGNDDNIVADLLTPYRFEKNGKPIVKRFVGGLLGHWAFWTKNAVTLLDQVKRLNPTGIPEMLTKGIEITDANAAVFDPANHFHGCITGINEVLRRQGLLATNLCLEEKETLSPGQSAEIDRVYRAYKDMHDDQFIKDNLQRWLS
ncbi:MAG: dihydrodipicolinate synthase family protein [Marivirga sp.]|nr:dihydrodipicolinate synthase family protein [Marivirga sp.]